MVRGVCCSPSLLSKGKGVDSSQAQYIRVNVPNNAIRPTAPPAESKRTAPIVLPKSQFEVHIKAAVSVGVVRAGLCQRAKVVVMVVVGGCGSAPSMLPTALIAFAVTWSVSWLMFSSWASNVKVICCIKTSVCSCCEKLQISRWS